MRRRLRDPRSLMELRRLAHRAPRSPEAREVLHDALLETFPEQYTEAIEDVHREAREALDLRRYGYGKVEYVIFFSTQMLRWKKLGARPHLSALFVPVASPFTGFMEPRSEKVHTEAIERYLRRSQIDTRIKKGVIVYRTRGAL